MSRSFCREPQVSEVLEEVDKEVAAGKAETHEEHQKFFQDRGNMEINFPVVFTVFFEFYYYYYYYLIYFLSLGPKWCFILFSLAS